MAGQVKPIPVPVILAAVNGDENALAAVVAHYQKYIRALATRPVKDEYGYLPQIPGGPAPGSAPGHYLYPAGPRGPGSLWSSAGVDLHLRRFSRRLRRSAGVLRPTGRPLYPGACRGVRPSATEKTKVLKLKEF